MQAGARTQHQAPLLCARAHARQAGRDGVIRLRLRHVLRESALRHRPSAAHASKSLRLEKGGALALPLGARGQRLAAEAAAAAAAAAALHGALLFAGAVAEDALAAPPLLRHLQRFAVAVVVRHLHLALAVLHLQHSGGEPGFVDGPPHLDAVARLQRRGRGAHRGVGAVRRAHHAVGNHVLSREGGAGSSERPVHDVRKVAPRALRRGSVRAPWGAPAHRRRGRRRST